MLEETIPIWPPMAEQKLIQDKYALTQLLDQVAESMSSSLPCPRPQTYTVAEATELPPEVQRDNIVLKRNSSSCKRHVILPPIRRSLEQAIQRLDRNGRLGVHGTWFAQDFIENLKSVGEIRVYLNGCKSIESIIATKFKDHQSDELEVEFIRSIPPLTDIPE